MQISGNLLLSYLAATGFVAAAPMLHNEKTAHMHHRRQDWGAIDWTKIKYDFSGVDWTTVKYDLSNVDFKTPAAAAPPAPTPNAPVYSPAEVQAAAPVVVAQIPQAAALPTPPPVVVQQAAAPVLASSGGRRGLGWDPTLPAGAAHKYAGNKVSWYFNWSPEPMAGMPSNWEFYANQWGSGDIANLANRLQGRPKLIGFNEPDSTTQANLSPGVAVGLYKQYLTGLKGQGKISQLGTPAITNSQQPGEGLSWLSQFMGGCGDCGLDFAVVHWYSTDFEDFKNHVTRAHEITGLPVNVAEFAYTAWQPNNEPSTEAVQDFLNKAVAWLEAQSFVSAYAWFGSMYVSEAKYPALGAANSLITPDLNNLTPLGYTYAI